MLKKKHIDNIILFIAFFPIAIPLYFDFSDFSIVLYDKNDVFSRIRFPVPLGLITFSIYYAYGILNNFYNDSRFYFVLNLKDISIYLYILIIVFLLSIISDASLARIIQIILPVILLIFMPLIGKKSDISNSIKYSLLGFSIFITAHLFSIFTNSLIPLFPRNFEFAMIFGFVIYQALISYVSVILLFITLLITIWIFRSKIVFSSNLFIYFILIISTILIAMGGRRVSFVDLFFIFIVLNLYQFSRIYNYKLNKKILLLTSMMFLLVVVSFAIGFEIIIRWQKTIEGEGINLDRIDHIKRFIDVVNDNPKILFIGLGTNNLPGYHNYFLDTIHRVGLLSSLAIFIMIFNLIINYYKLINIDIIRFMTIILISQLIINSTFNSALTQPYYFVNWAFIYLILNSLGAKKKLK